MTCLFQGYVKFVDLTGENTHRLNHTGYISLLVVRGVSTSWIHEMFQTRLQDEHMYVIQHKHGMIRLCSSSRQKQVETRIWDGSCFIVQ